MSHIFTPTPNPTPETHTIKLIHALSQWTLKGIHYLTVLFVVYIFTLCILHESSEKWHPSRQALARVRSRLWHSEPATPALLDRSVAGLDSTKVTPSTCWAIKLLYCPQERLYCVCMCGQEMECNINTTWQSIPCHTDCKTKQAAFPPEHPTIVDHGCWPCDLMLKDGGGPRRVCVSQKSIKGGDLFTSWLWHLKGAHCERGIVSENTKDQLAALLGARARTRTRTSTSHI